MISAEQTIKKIKRLLTVSNFQRWLKTRNPEERFSYINNTDCAIARFLKEKGVELRNHGISVGHARVWCCTEESIIPGSVFTRLQHFIESGVAHTMGNLHKFFL